MTNQIRQGDLLIKKIAELPKGLKVVADRVLLRGESTGHSHRLESGNVLKDKSGAMFLQLLTPTFLVHEEHKPIKLGIGNYAVIRQREYMAKDMTRVVVD